MKITLEIDSTTAALLAVLADQKLSDKNRVKEVLETLIDHARQGVYRPGAWERQWITQCFSDDFEERLEPGCPFGRPDCDHLFQKPIGYKPTKTKTKVTIV